MEPIFSDRAGLALLFRQINSIKTLLYLLFKLLAIRLDES
jgi:hypothetical protein